MWSVGSICVSSSWCTAHLGVDNSEGIVCHGIHMSRYVNRTFYGPCQARVPGFSVSGWFLGVCLLSWYCTSELD